MNTVNGQIILEEDYDENYEPTEEGMRCVQTDEIIGLKGKLLFSTLVDVRCWLLSSIIFENHESDDRINISLIVVWSHMYQYSIISWINGS